MRIIDWSSDVCSSDLFPAPDLAEPRQCRGFVFQAERAAKRSARDPGIFNPEQQVTGLVAEWLCSGLQSRVRRFNSDPRSEEHTSELQSLMRISYAVFCLKKKNTKIQPTQHTQI